MLMHDQEKINAIDSIVQEQEKEDAEKDDEVDDGEREVKKKHARH